MDKLIFINAAILVLFPISLYILRKWVIANVEKGVQHKFDERIEIVRTELKKSEEVFKTALRAKETEIATLREGVFAGRVQRQILLETRRLKAVENIWETIAAFASLKFIAGILAAFKLNDLAKSAKRDEYLREFFKVIGQGASKDKLPQNKAASERPFVSPLAWAYFSAYQAIVMNAAMQITLLSSKLDGIDTLIKGDHIKDIIKAAVPHFAEFIDKNESNAFYHLLENLEQSLLTELRRMLEGEDADQANAVQAAKILEATRGLMEENAKKTIELEM